MNKLKLVTPESTNHIFITKDSNDDPVLAYKNGDLIIELGKGGSPTSRLLDCSSLYNILSNYFIKGTKFIISTYNPVLYYLFPGSYDQMFNPSTDFVPTLKVGELVRGEVNGFDPEFIATQESVRSIKACDSWNNNPEEKNEAEKAVDDQIKIVFGFYKDFEDLDIDKEVNEFIGPYSVDLNTTPLTVDLISDSLYTDTINLEDWAYESGNSGDLEAKLDVSFMYSIGDDIYGGSQTIEAFKYSGGNLIITDYIISLENIQLEYIGSVLKIYPINQEIGEVIFNDACLTIGV